MKRVTWFVGLMFLLIVTSASSAVTISAASAMQQATSWTGYYFNNMYLQGGPVFTRDDPYIDFNWGTWGPGGGIPGTNFSVRWLRWAAAGFRVASRSSRRTCSRTRSIW